MALIIIKVKVTFIRIVWSCYSSLNLPVSLISVHFSYRSHCITHQPITIQLEYLHLSLHLWFSTKIIQNRQPPLVFISGDCSHRKESVEGPLSSLHHHLLQTHQLRHAPQSISSLDHFLHIHSDISIHACSLSVSFSVQWNSTLWCVVYSQNRVWHVVGI